MIRVVALVEGPTERNFGQSLLAPHLANFGIAFSPKVIGKPGHKGGNLWEPAKRDITALLKSRPHACTTMFDLYGLLKTWPGRSEARTKKLAGVQAAQFIENAIAADIAVELPTLPRGAFIPYLSVHEYEALLFSDPDKLASVTLGKNHARQFAEIVEKSGGCESINDDPATAPSKRIKAIALSYDKAADGPVAAERIGLATMRTKCRHFNEWLAKLEQLGT